jgi:hypothetical protein
MGRKGALNYLPIVPKASIYVPKVMRTDRMARYTPFMARVRVHTVSKLTEYESWEADVIRIRTLQHHTVKEDIIIYYLLMKPRHLRTLPNTLIMIKQ